MNLADTRCPDCVHYRGPAMPGAVPTCARAGQPNACVLAYLRCDGAHWRSK